MSVVDEIGEVEAMRREILSYRFEVDRLVADYVRLQKFLEQTRQDSREAAARETRLIEMISGSRSWRYTKWLRKLTALLRNDRNFKDEDRFALAGRGAYWAAACETRRDFPRLPSLPQIGYVESKAALEKTWETAEFLSMQYYDQLQMILERPENRGKPVFIQMVTIDWFVPLYQRPQHMALAMAEQGYVVFYMTGNGQFDKAFGFHEVAPGVFITNQPVPLMLDQALVSFYSTSPVMEYWLGSYGNQFKDRGHVVIYEYIDHIDPEISFEFTDALVRQFQQLSPDIVHLGVASAQALIDELHEKVPSIPIAYVPNGVDVDHYERTVGSDHGGTVPAEMRQVMNRGRPIIGYFGALAPWLWYSVINELTRQRQDLTFVFIGPDYLGSFDLLAEGDNVFKLGAVDYSLLPYFAQHFDVGIIPFKPGDIARTTSPLKLFEYFALGLPVVVTDGMDECTAFTEVLSAGSVEEYSAALDTALGMRTDRGYRSACASLAEANTWSRRAEVLDGAARPLLASREPHTT